MVRWTQKVLSTLNKREEKDPENAVWDWNGTGLYLGRGGWDIGVKRAKGSARLRKRPFENKAFQSGQETEGISLRAIRTLVTL